MQRGAFKRKAALITACNNAECLVRKFATRMLCFHCRITSLKWAGQPLRLIIWRTIIIKFE